MIDVTCPQCGTIYHSEEASFGAPEKKDGV